MHKCVYERTRRTKRAASPFPTENARFFTHFSALRSSSSLAMPSRDLESNSRLDAFLPPPLLYASLSSFSVYLFPPKMVLFHGQNPSYIYQAPKPRNQTCFQDPCAKRARLACSTFLAAFYFFHAAGRWSTTKKA